MEVEYGFPNRLMEILQDKNIMINDIYFTRRGPLGGLLVIYFLSKLDHNSFIDQYFKYRASLDGLTVYDDYLVIKIESTSLNYLLNLVYEGQIK